MRHSEALAAALTNENYAALQAVAREHLWRALGYLLGRLCSADEAEKWRAVRALGHLTRDPALVPTEQVEELLRRCLWALSDESGAVPWGIPEAMAEVLTTRFDLQARYVPILGSCLTSDEMCQVGAIERGVIWGLGRIGRGAAAYAPEAVDALRQAATHHPDDETRGVALQALRAIED